MHYKLNMKLTNEQINQIAKACEDVEFGSVTIKMNATSNFVDLVVEKHDVDIDVTTDRVDEVVTTDGQSITVTGCLPNGQVRVGHLHTG